MISLLSLWLPIVLSAVGVFIVSSIIHMVLGYHAKDFRPLPNEEGFKEAIQGLNLSPGDYAYPCARSAQEWKDPAFQKKMKEGPIVFFTLLSPEQAKMGLSLFWWFVYSLIVSLFSGYLASRALGRGAEFWEVVRFAGTPAFLSYAMAHWANTIWFKRSLGTTLRNTLDGLLYGLATGIIFAFFWP